ncbi:lasso peptide biosynthesis PqqD family chaperone [Micromonospora sp. FIMYZ51]|uniref:lasso peptide biosynthesis PqqD family chaperone n=1 Tax=Micromonospora sp. FIMYZ51 TaxID=3051832 RepID=UPI00311D7A0F
MTVRLHDHVLLTETEDGAVLLDERRGRYWQLNGSGALLLTMLLSGAVVEQAATALMDRYPVDGERALADVRALVSGLRAAGLVR